MDELVRHRQTKEPATDRSDLNHRATSRLYPPLSVPVARMNAEQKPRQTSLRSFFGYLTLACFSIGAYRGASALPIGVPIKALIGVSLMIATCSVIGAAMGSLFGRAGVGATIGTALTVLWWCALAYIDPPR